MLAALVGMPAGNSLYVRPLSVRPVACLRTPPHCLKKNGTPCSRHWRSMPTTQSVRIAEEIAHRVDEDSTRATPRQRLIQLFRHDAKVEAALEGVTRHASKALREPLGVAVPAAGADLGTAADRVPGGVGPLDPRTVAHRAKITRTMRFCNPDEMNDSAFSGVLKVRVGAGFALIALV